MRGTPLKLLMYSSRPLQATEVQGQQLTFFRQSPNHINRFCVVDVTDDNQSYESIGARPPYDATALGPTQPPHNGPKRQEWPQMGPTIMPKHAPNCLG